MVHSLTHELMIHFLCYRFDDEEKNLSTDVDYRNATSLFNVTITTQVSKNDIRDESPVTCWMKINDTDYEIKETTIYDGMLLKIFLFNHFLRFLLICND